jgi:hypothetical protein
MMYPSDGLPALGLCGRYAAGHDMHFIQARLSGEHASLGERTIDAITPDGTIRFTDDTTCWNHHPERLQAMIDRSDRRVELRRCSVLAVPGNGCGWLFSVASEVDPCHPDTAERHPRRVVPRRTFTSRRSVPTPHFEARTSDGLDDEFGEG